MRRTGPAVEPRSPAGRPTPEVRRLGPEGGARPVPGSTSVSGPNGGEQPVLDGVDDGGEAGALERGVAGSPRETGCPR